MSFSFFNSGSKSKKFAVFSIDTSAVTLTVIEKNNTGATKVLYAHKLSLEIDVIHEPGDILRVISKRIEQLFVDIQKQNLYSLLKHSTDLFVLVGSPWHIGWNDKIEIKREKEFKITHEFLNDAIRESFTSAHNDLAITSVDVVGYKLNGYEIDNPVGKITTSVDVRMYISSAPKLFIETVQKNIKLHVPHNKISFVSLVRATGAALQTLVEDDSFLFVLPENETTEIILIKKNIFIGEASIPFGGATLARSLFGPKSSGIKESLSKTKRFIAGKLESEDLDLIGKILEDQKKEFMTNFRDTLWKINDTLILPDTLVIVGKNIASHFLMDWVKEEEYSSQTFTANGFKILNIRGNDLLAKVDVSGLPAKKTVPFAVSLAVSTVKQLTNNI